MLFEKYKKKIYYCLYQGRVPNIVDGKMKGYKVVYGDPKEFKIHVGWARGTADTDMFGITLDYDKPMVTNWMECPIDENTVLFVDKEPDFDSNGNPLYDYIVKNVAKSKNYITYAIKKVSVT